MKINKKVTAVIVLISIIIAILIITIVCTNIVLGKEGILKQMASSNDNNKIEEQSDNNGTTPVVTYASSDQYKDVPYTDSSLFIFDKNTGAIKGLESENYYDKEVAYPNIIKIPEKIDGVEVKSINITPIIENGRRHTETRDITDIIMPNTVTELSDGAFKGLKSLRNVVMSNKINRIGNRAFYCCSSLENIDIPNTVTFIGKEAFCHTISLQEITINGKEVQLGERCFGYSGIKKATINAKVTNAINNDCRKNQCAFFGCSIEELNLNEAYIGIAECYKLKTINAKTLGVKLFKCPNIEKIKTNKIAEDFFGIYIYKYKKNKYQDDEKESTNISYIEINGVSYSKDQIDEMFISKEKKKEIVLSPEYTSNTITAEDFKDYYAKGKYVTEINIPEGVTKIEDNVFKYINGTYKVHLPSTIREIGDNVFENGNLISINLPEGLQKIGTYALFALNRSANVVIPSTVEEIGDYAFGYKTIIYCRATSAPSGWSSRWNYDYDKQFSHYPPYYIPSGQKIIWGYTE